MQTSPFLKWPGGKRWFVARHGYLLPREYRSYIEPFLGGGSVFFHLRPALATIGDTNKELISAYCGVRDDPDGVEETLLRHESRHSKTYYYQVRNYSPRTCFNGIYRVNSHGRFNVPKGTKDVVTFDEDNFEDVALLLRRAKIRMADFEELIDGAQRHDLIFADPPYTVHHNSNAFIRYNEKLFSWDDQVRLANALARARDRGARIVVTNASHTTIKRLYVDRGFHLQSVSRYSPISATPEHRERFEELIGLDCKPKSRGTSGRFNEYSRQDNR
jgi:DNA adenine methylase